MAHRELEFDRWEVADGETSTAEMWLSTHQEVIDFIDRFLAAAPAGYDTSSLEERREQLRARVRYWKAELRRLRRASARSDRAGGVAGTAAD